MSTKRVEKPVADCRARGLCLAEALITLVIGSMVLVAVLAVYARIERSSEAATVTLDSSRLAEEVLQRIAEDLDKIVVASSDTLIQLPGNKRVKGLASSRLEIIKNVYNSENKPVTFERIIWQTYPDPYGNGMILYRAHSGIVGEDKLLDQQKEDWERQLFVPVCQGVTFFQVQAIKNGKLFEKWASPTLPMGVVVTISFAEPYETVGGVLDVPEEEKITRTIAVDRTRSIRFNFASTLKSLKAAEDPNSENIDQDNAEQRAEPAEPNQLI